MIKLTLPKRTPPQKKISNSNKRFKVVCFGRQSGKTTNGLWRMTRVLEGPENAIYWHILQTNSAAEVAFNRFVKLFPRDSWDVLFEKRPNESERTVFLVGNRQVHFKSGDNFQNLRAETLHGCIIDECREQDAALWKQVIRPMLGRYKGWCDFYSTPNGFDWFYDLYQNALKYPDEWEVFHAPSTEAWWWTPEEIISAKQTMSDAEFAQEIMAEFRDLTQGKAYLTFSKDNILNKNPFTIDGTINPYLPIHIGLDFNVSPMSWCLAQKKGDHLHFFDEISMKGTNTQECVKVLIDKVKDHKLGVILVGDASGNSQSTKSDGKSDYDILCQALDSNNIKWINLTPSFNPGVRDRVNTINARLRSATGQVHITVDETKCPELKKDFERVVWKMNAGKNIVDQTTDKDRTHMSDAAGYLVCQVLPIDVASKKPGVLSVIVR